MLSKDASSTIFRVFGMTRPGIEPRSPKPLANTLTILPMSGTKKKKKKKKQHVITKHKEDTDKLKSPDIRNILINNAKIIYKNNKKNRLQILEAITIKIYKNNDKK